MEDILTKTVGFKEVYKGDFDFEIFYKRLHDWFRYYDWVANTATKEGNAERSEILYRQNDLGNGLSEHHIWWRLKKSPPEGDDFLYEINVNIQTIAISKKEIVFKGKKIKADSGEISVDVACKLIFLPEKDTKNEKSSWSKPMWKNMLKLYKRLKKDQIEMAWKKMYTEIYKLKAHIKRYLNLRQFAQLPETELFHPSKEYTRAM